MANRSPPGSRKRKATDVVATRDDPSPEKKSRNAERSDSTSSDDASTSGKKSSEKGRKRKRTTRDDAFEEFQRVCRDIAKVDAYTDKTAVLRKMLVNGCEGGEFFFGVVCIAEFFPKTRMDTDEILT